MVLGLTGLGAMLATARSVNAQAKAPKPTPATAPGKPGEHDHGEMKAATPSSPALTAALAAIIASTSDCQRDGRYCLARCTDHLVAGGSMMAECQRSVMNMLAVTAAMADVVGYRNANPKNIKALASACAQFCRACALTCEPHKDHHEECKACMESCLACAKACEAYSA
jgi:Cys-rich four helix bundle protein (predicted Tat secretion target)